jgi:hypothetical protein
MIRLTRAWRLPVRTAYAASRSTPGRVGDLGEVRVLLGQQGLGESRFAVTASGFRGHQFSPDGVGERCRGY